MRLFTDTQEMIHTLNLQFRLLQMSIKIMAVFSLQTDPGVAKPQPACSSAQCQGPSLCLLHGKGGQDLVFPSAMFSKAVPQHTAPDVYHCLMLFF